MTTTIKKITDAMEAIVIIARMRAPLEVHNAILTFGDLLMNCHEEIDAFNEFRGGVKSLYLDGKLREIPARALRDHFIHFGQEDIAAVLEVAEKHHLNLPIGTEISFFDENDMPVTMGTGEALALTIAFFARHMEEIFTVLLSSIKLPENFFTA